MLGGIPKDPKIIEAWLRSKMGINDDEEVKQQALQTLRELGAAVDANMSYEQLLEASQALASEKNTNGFKQDEDGLYLESRVVKAMFREAVAILFPYPKYKMGATKKAARKFFNERVFIESAEDIEVDRQGNLHLGVTKPDGIVLRIMHIEDKGERRSALSYFEYVRRAVLKFDVLVLEDCVPAEWWPKILVHSGENGLGASRAQDFGKFTPVMLEPVEGRAAGLYTLTREELAVAAAEEIASASPEEEVPSAAS